MIPAYNASKTILTLANKIDKTIPKKDIIIIDDGSSDSTYQLAKESEVVVIQHQKNKGKGEALKTGFEYAIRNGYDALITIDADLQHDPVYIKDFIARAENDFCGIIVGTRNISLKMMPFLRWLTNNLTSIIISVLAGTKIRDSQSGYRLISTQVLKSIDLRTKKYDLESEILIKAGRKRFEIDEVSISTIYEGSKSFINPFVDTFRFLRLIWRSLWW